VLVSFVLGNTVTLPAQQVRQRPFAVLDRLATQILAVELDQIEGAKDCRLAGPVPAGSGRIPQGRCGR
jgi:hypothetical protein